MDRPRWALDANPLGLLFRDAYAELRRLLGEQPSAGLETPAPLAELAAARMDAALGNVCHDLESRVGRRAPQNGHDGLDALLFAFAVVADETLLNEDWPGRAAWRSHLLERRLFKTSSGGARLIERIDAVTRQGDRASREIAEVYLHCLTLGFAGRLRGREGSLPELASRRHQLFAYLYPDQATLGESGFVLTEGREENLVRSTPGQRGVAAQARVWLLAAAILALPLLVSIGAWLALRAILADTLKLTGAA
jgi:type IV/VI secretion system ImpK/VasF family protein